MDSVLYLRHIDNPTLVLKLYRREPAITEFDWNFTAIHRSSANVSTAVGSVLQKVLPCLQPVHGQITLFRVYCHILKTHYQYSLSLRLRLFHLNLACNNNSPAHTSKRTPSHLCIAAHSALALCKLQVSCVYFTPISGFFSSFLHSTCSLSVNGQYLGLPNGLGRFRQDYTCPALLRILLGTRDISNTGGSPSMPSCSKDFFYIPRVHVEVLQPQRKLWFVLIPFRSPLLRESLRFLFLSLLRCFTSRGSLFGAMYSLQNDIPEVHRISTFGNPGIGASYQLPLAYRRLARPSSPSISKKSTSSS